MDSSLVLVDDKHVPLYRIMWVAATPHFCGEEDCMREGQYEIMLEMDEVVWASGDERDRVLEALRRWCGDGRGGPTDDDPEESDW
jgi:hypothetical protein